MLKNNAFNRTLLSTAVAAAMTGMTSYAFAQEAGVGDATLEEVEVVGIRSSLMKSADVKRDSMGVTDAITAEDMGKFPDSNLAESLQRIAGVSIERENGEGKGVTVRGLGPRFNLVQINGRQTAAASGSRSFDFSTISPDMIRAVEVYKTSAADRETGGMGATINVETMRPLNEPGERFIFSGKGIYDESARDAEVKPELSGIYSNTFDDNKFGVALAVNYQERVNGRDEARDLAILTNEWGQPSRDWQNSQGAVDNENQVNKPVDGDLFALSRMNFYEIVNQEHERANAQAVFQWRPTESITATADYNFFRKDIDTVTNKASLWYEWDQASSTAVWSDDPIKAPLVYAEVTRGANPGETTFAVEEQHVRNELQSYGINVEWDVSDTLSLEFDANGSSNSVTPNGGRLGSKADVEMASLTRRALAADFTGDIPSLFVNNPNVVPADVVPLTHRITSQFDEAEVDQFKFSGHWDFTEEQSLDFGVQATNVFWSTGNVRVERGRGYYEQYKGDFVNFEGFDSFNFMSGFDASYGDFETIAAQLPNGTFLMHPWTGENYTFTADNLYQETLTFDLNEMMDYLEQNYGAYDQKDSPLTTLGNCGSVFCASNKYEFADYQEVGEDTRVAFMQYNLNSELAGMPFDVHVGYRYEETEVTASSALNDYQGVVWVKDNQFSFRPEVDENGNQVQTLASREASYDYHLPSLNLNVNVTDDIVARVAYGKSLARANLPALRGGRVLQTETTNIVNPPVRTGNPALKPLESENFDLSVEWYYDEGSYVSAAWFKKNIDGFPKTVNTLINIDGLYSPAFGQFAQEAQAAGAQSIKDVFEWILANKADEPGVTSNGSGTGQIEGDASRDPLVDFQIGFTENGEDKNGVDGIELSVQHMFGESGFGVMANYTKVNSDVGYSPYTLEGSTALLGVSDSANVVGFYDKNGLQARVAYNWRDKYLKAHTQELSLIEPIFVNDFQTVDLNVSYALTDNAEIFLQGINVLDENNSEHGRGENLMISHEETGARWMLGGRYTF
ncbi:TonB-dependent receptor [Microbulbifer sp. YPW1]|uniref:TonB-dependent receptor n=1 Tax=Microbulbifer sp. YPW1 TaxID=2745199 RepID=UPI001599E2EE|nr:TonB-dependent receptor [Microbulbifer sp. YPW1]QKX17615.1 TonB-dependent receptor [Microbulbifer sp. YPW1]